MSKEEGKFSIDHSNMHLDFKSMEIDTHMLKTGKTKKVYVFKLLNKDIGIKRSI